MTLSSLAAMNTDASAEVVLSNDESASLASAFGRGNAYSLIRVEPSSLIKACNGLDSSISVNLLGENLVVANERVEANPREGVLHWYGSVVGEEKSHVRLTIDSDSLFGKQREDGISPVVTGVIQYRGKDYTISPISNSGAQVVYPSSENGGRQLKLSESRKVNQRNRYVAALGIRKDLLDQIDSGDFTIGIGGAMTVAHGLDASVTGGLEFRSEADIGPLLDTIGPLLPLIGEESFRFNEKMGKSGGGWIFDFDQYIGDTPVVGAHFRVFANPDGLVTRFQGRIEPDMGYEPKPAIDKAEALQIALEAVHREGMAAFQSTEIESHVVYLLNPLGAESRVAAGWVVYLASRGITEPYLVNGETRSVRRRSVMMY